MRRFIHAPLLAALCFVGGFVAEDISAQSSQSPARATADAKDKKSEDQDAKARARTYRSRLLAWRASWTPLTSLRRVATGTSGLPNTTLAAKGGNGGGNGGGGGGGGGGGNGGGNNGNGNGDGGGDPISTTTP